MQPSMEKMASGGEAFGDDQGDVIVLFVRAEGADFVDDGGEKRLGIQVTMATKGCREAGFAKFLTGRVEGFGDAVGVENERVAGTDLAFGEIAIPLFEGAHDGGRSS
jgi:hypothetical protein